MKNALLIVLFFLSTGLMAQDKPFQVSVGLNKSWFRYEHSYDFPRPNFRPKFNVAVSYEFAKFGNFAANAGVRYYDLLRSVTCDIVNYPKYTVNIDHTLISLPLQLKYEIGIFNTDIILNAETSYILKSNDDYPTARDITSEMNRLQFSIGLGLEYNIKIANENFGITSIYNYGLTNVPKEGYFSDGDKIYSWDMCKISELNLAISYYF